MDKRVNYKGITASPSDYLSSDGELSLAMNMISEDGSLKPIGKPKTIFSLERGQTVVYIHKTSNFEHFLVRDGYSLYWRTKNDSTLNKIRDFSTEILQISSIGNTLVVLTDSTNFFLWNKKESSTEYGYYYLGNKMPEINIGFGLTNHFYNNVPVYDGTSLSIELPTPVVSSNLYDTENKANNEYLRNLAIATINSYIGEKIEYELNEGRFYFPFLLRYAYRLYDGTLTMHSAPVLMLPNAKESPVVRIISFDGEENLIKSIEMRVDFSACSIDYRPLIYKEVYENLRNWSDIIKSVDVFVSLPIYTYNQSLDTVEGKTFKKQSESTYTVSKLENISSKMTNYKAYYQKSENDNLLWESVDYQKNEATEINTSITLLNLLHKDEKTLKKEIEECGTFFFLKSLELKDINPSDFVDEDYNITYRKIEIEKGYLSALAAKEAMTDDYNSHNTITAKNVFAYNSRLNLANVSEVPFDGFDRSGCQERSNGYLLATGFNEFTDLTNQKETMYHYYTWVFLNKDGKEIVLKTNDWMDNFSDSPRYFFYPDSSAYRMVVVREDNVTGTKSYLDITLTEHALLNGAVYFNGFSDTVFSNTKPSGLTETSDNLVSLPNKIYTSEVNNPFYFPVSGINTVGTGQILGVSSAVKALSEGQFGQFPLYVFSSDGVWAMEVSDKGLYSTRQPVTRDVCNNPDSITQIDNAVLFTTDRGIMMIAGSETVPITDMLRGEEVNLSSYPFFERLRQTFYILNNFMTGIDFFSYIKNCRMAYDYENQRILAYNPEYNYALMFSLRSKMWTMTEGNYASTVNSYPDCYVMTNDSRLVNMSDIDNSGIVYGLIFTRPFKLDYPDVHKTISRLIQKGRFHSDRVQQVLYASNDLYNWFCVSSSKNAIIAGIHGSPYKYYRLLVFVSFSKGEDLSSFITSMEARQTNKIR